MCMGAKNNPVTAEDYYTGYQAADGSYVGGMKRSYELPSLRMGDSVERSSELSDVKTPELQRGTGATGQKRRTFFQQYGVDQ